MNALIARLRAPFSNLIGSATGWIVGGALRDTLRGIAADDVDIAVPGDARPLARALANEHGAGCFQLSKEFNAWRVHSERLPFTIDLTPLQGSSLVEDLARRDFTMNALALPLDGGELIDPHDGERDLEAGRLRMVGAAAFSADPVRLMRLGRFARQLNLRLEAETARQARTDAPLLAGAPPERVLDELARTIRTGGTRESLELLDEIGVLTQLVPQLEDARRMEQTPYHHKDVLGHTLEVVQGVEEIVADPEPVFRSSAPRVEERLSAPLANELTRGQALVIAAILHDVAKPATRAVSPEGRVTFMRHDVLGAEMAGEWCMRFRTSNRVRDFVSNCVRQHLVLGFLVHRQPLSLRQIDRYLRRVAPEEVELSVLTVADRLATRGARTGQAAIDRHLALARQVTATYFGLIDRGPIRSPLDGAELARRLDREPGPWLKDLLDALREEVLVGRISTPDGATAFAKTWVPEAQMGESDQPRARRRR
ncbi:MAG: HD domain-containing protein [Thermoleophilia bacterium]|nr:HD domain-containing protein [Thermoleophilia bacterium]MDH3724626.1 HD domain-containing protein [Thermoleophilia bacterium]